MFFNREVSQAEWEEQLKLEEQEWNPVYVTDDLGKGITLKPCPLCGSSPLCESVWEGRDMVIHCPRGCKPAPLRWHAVIQSHFIGATSWAQMVALWNTIRLEQDAAGVSFFAFDGPDSITAQQAFCARHDLPTGFGITAPCTCAPAKQESE